jgi:hypothetical protein
VIAVDTNILVYAHREDSPWHERAYVRIAQLAEGRAAWALPWPCIHEFIAIVTHPRIFDPASPLQKAIEQIEAWLESPSLSLITESAQHWTTLKEALTSGRIAGPQVHDARIAALCTQHGVRELWSADRDFGKFAKLKVINPLVN